GVQTCALPISYRTVATVPFAIDRLRRLLEAEAATIQFDPSSLAGLIGMSNPEQMQEMVADQLSEVFDSEETAAARAETEAFLGLLGGYARLLAERATAELLPDRERIVAARDEERVPAEAQIPFGPAPPRSQAIEEGRTFCL